VCLRVLVGTIIAMPTIIDQQVRGTTLEASRG